MTKTQKSLYNKLKKPAHQRAFVQMLGAQQAVMGKYTHWAARYERKCHKKGVDNPTLRAPTP